MQIPACRASLLTSYGEVYLKAWKLAEGQVRITIGARACALHSANAGPDPVLAPQRSGACRT